MVFLRQEVELFDGEVGMCGDEELHAALGELVDHPQELDDGLGMQGGLDFVEEDNGLRRQVAIGQQLVEYRDFLDALGRRIDGIERVALLVVPLALLLVVVDGAAQDIPEDLAAIGKMLVVVAALTGQLQGLDEVKIGIIEAVHHILLTRFQDDILQGQDFFSRDEYGVAVAILLERRPGLQDFLDRIPPELIGDGFSIHFHRKGQFAAVWLVDQVAKAVGLEGPVQLFLQDVLQGLLCVAAPVLLQCPHRDIHRLQDEGLPRPIDAEKQIDVLEMLPLYVLVHAKVFGLYGINHRDISFPIKYKSICTFAEGDGLDGLEEVHEVDPDGPVADVPGVHGDALFVGGVAAAAGLPHAGDAGQDHAVLAEVVAVALDLFGDDGPWSDEAHVAADDVPELRQLVEAGLAEEGAELGDARVVLELEVLFPLFAGLGVFFEVFLEGFLRVRDHGLELVAREEHAIPADALVGEDDVALIADGDHDGQCDEDRRNQDAADGRADDVEDALDDAVATAREVVPHVEHEDFFGEEDFGLDADHRGADEVGRKGNVAHVGLYLGDELLELVAVHARCGDDDVLDAGIADDGFGVGDFAVEQEARGELLGQRVVVDEADDVVTVAEVIFVIAQDALGRLARADEDDGLVEEVALLDEFLGEVADQVEIRHQEHDEEADEEARGMRACG